MKTRQITPFGPLWSAKYLHFGFESCEIRTLSSYIQETCTLRKIKNFFYRVENKFQNSQDNFMVYCSKSELYLDEYLDK